MSGLGHSSMPLADQRVTLTGSPRHRVGTPDTPLDNATGLGLEVPVGVLVTAAILETIKPSKPCSKIVKRESAPKARIPEQFWGMEVSCVPRDYLSIIAEWFEVPINDIRELCSYKWPSSQKVTLEILFHSLYLGLMPRNTGDFVSLSELAASSGVSLESLYKGVLRESFEVFARRSDVIRFMKVQSDRGAPLTTRLRQQHRESKERIRGKYSVNMTDVSELTLEEQESGHYMSVKDAVRESGWTREYITEMIHKGTIKDPRKIGRAWAFSRSSWSEFLKGRSFQKQSVAEASRLLAHS